MTDAGSAPDEEIVGLGISGGFAHLPGRAGERVRRLADLDAPLLTELLAATDASAFFTRPDPDGAVQARPDARTYHVRLAQGGRWRVLTVPEPFETPELARLVRAARRCL